MRLALAITILLMLPLRAEAQQSESRCEGSPPDSLWLASSRVYRNCEVDKKAKKHSNDPALDPDILRGEKPQGRCLRVELEFVVDTTGQPEPSTVRLRSTDSPALARTIIAMLSELQFTPARLAGRPVRQIVLYKRSVATIISFMARRASPGEQPPSSSPLSLQAC